MLQPRAPKRAAEERQTHDPRKPGYTEEIAPKVGFRPVGRLRLDFEKRNPLPG